MPEEAEPIYQSFLVRCWLLSPATAEDPAVWRFELREVVAEPKKLRFSDITQLIAFMAAKLSAIASGSAQDSHLEGGDKGFIPSPIDK